MILPKTAITAASWIAVIIILQDAYAQTTATTPTMPTITPTCDDPLLPCIEAGGEFAIPIVQQARAECTPSTARGCADIAYASGNLVILTGETIPQVRVNVRADNHVIWQAVNQIMAQGFSIQSISVSGSGVESNPHVFHVVMAK